MKPHGQDKGAIPFGRASNSFTERVRRVCMKQSAERLRNEQ